MKLDDIDVLNKARADYNDVREQLAGLREAHYNLQIIIGGTTIVKPSEQHGEVVPLLRAAITEVLTKQQELHITRLMQLGITEFPE